MDYILLSVVSMVFGACVGVTIMAVMIAGSKADDWLGDRQREE